ncbi:MAG: sulfotransferase family 2 domain-containing protein [Rhodospirillales bacterium]|nr:sulfotransferase family 2 domain-containing protein [Rhodospirillales bacterium]MBO6788670.1 sulfotransferase family 2 domain-containing protein [Rhodospirillales bacterium]
MVISDRYKYLYFVIPKCGSATVRHALAPFTDIGYPVSRFEEHVTIRKFLDNYDAPGRFDTHFKFSFVRNPYDRLYSGFCQDRLASTKWEHWIAAKRPIFDAIGDDFAAYMLDHVAQADIANAWDWICFCPMTAFTHLDGRQAVDWIGRTEWLDGGLAELAGKIGVALGDVKSLNVQTPADTDQPDRPKYLGCYTRDVVAMVNEIYAEDFRAFEYPVLDPADFPAVL